MLGAGISKVAPATYGSFDGATNAETIPIQGFLVCGVAGARGGIDIPTVGRGAVSSRSYVGKGADCPEPDGAEQPDLHGRV